MANEEQLSILKQGTETWNDWRDEHPETQIDLSGAKLSGAHLGGANLNGADLIRAMLTGAQNFRVPLGGANLSGANLAGANLCRANLTEARLSRANLSRTNLSETSLIGADLSEADLSGADLSEANLTDANVTGAKLIAVTFVHCVLTRLSVNKSFIGETTFSNADLSTAVGLEEVLHLKRSSISTDTIHVSKGKIPTVFLRGCGLSDLDIEYAKLAAPGLDPEQVAQITYAIHDLYIGTGIQYHSCFISYNNKDQEFARHLHDDLQNNGVRCWFAPEDLKTGDVFRKTIGEQIRLREKLLVIISENSIKSEWVGDEVEKALKEEKEQACLKLFPIRLDNAIFKSNDDWAEKIQLRRHIGDFSDWEVQVKYKRAFECLLRDLRTSGQE